MADRETGIWGKGDLLKGHKHDRKLVKAIGKMFDPKKVADLGCGDGWYCQYFKEYAGWPIVHGYEGAIPKEPLYEDIQFIDLSKIRYVEIGYDLVICLEVGEHIPKKHEQKFLDNVARFSSDKLVLSWAIPGQGGRGHFNEQTNEYVIGEMKKRGFDHLWWESEELRNNTELKWFKNTIMVFESEKSI